MSYKVAVIVGSLRKGSYSSLVAKALTEAAPDSLEFENVPIGDLPFFNQDLEAEPPAEWTTFRDKIKAADAVLFVTPEYNRSVPGVLKNAVDVGSRPYGQGALQGKPAMVAAQSPGQISGFGANHHLRQSLVFLNMPTMGQPEVYIGKTNTLFDEQGNLTNEETKKYLVAVMQSFADWVARFA